MEMQRRSGKECILVSRQRDYMYKEGQCDMALFAGYGQLFVKTAKALESTVLVLHSIHAIFEVLGRKKQRMKGNWIAVVEFLPICCTDKPQKKKRRERGRVFSRNFSSSKGAVGERHTCYFALIWQKSKHEARSRTHESRQVTSA